MYIMNDQAFFFYTISCFFLKLRNCEVIYCADPKSQNQNSGLYCENKEVTLLVSKHTLGGPVSSG